MARLSAEDWDGNQDAFRHAMASMPPEEFAEYLDGLPEPALDSLLRDTASFDASMPSTPLAQAMELDRAYKSRPHLKYLSDRIAVAVEDVKNGKSRQLAVSMPPRSGKSELVSKYLPVWLLRQNPTWKLGLMSYSPTLAASWSREVRRFIEQHGPTLGLEIATDAGAVGDWETTQKGEVHARSMGQGLTGFGANCVSGDARLYSERGTITAADAFENGVDWLLAYDHVTERAVWRRVEARQLSGRSRLVEVITTSGHVLRCTPDHPIYSGGQYRPAGELGVGDTVVSVDSAGAVFPVSTTGTQRSGKSSQTASHLCGSGVLLKDVRPRHPRRRAKKGLVSLRPGFSSKCQVLLRGLPTEGGSRSPYSNLPGVLDTLRSEVLQDAELLSGLREQGSLSFDDWAGQLSIPRRAIVHSGVPSNASSDTRTGRERLRGLPRGSSNALPLERSYQAPVSFSHPSYRRERSEQPSGEPRHALPGSPHNSPQVEYDTVAVVREVCGGEVSVYDFQVEGTSNFFADGLLVHNCLIIDDPIKDYATAHNENSRDALWNKWTADIRTRREPPSLTIVVQTRWHQTDFIGRLLSDKYVGDPNDWEVISFPALAEENDVLGRSKGDPLLSPLIPEDAALALEWWMGLKSGMSSYEWAALFQQRPAPATGAIFSTDWWGYWTTDPAKVSYSETSGEPDGKVILRPPDLMTAGRVLDSWDLNFDDTANSDFVVGQRWAKSGQRRFLVDQRRGRWDFPTTLREFEEWNGDGLVHEHLVEKKANGAAMIASMRNKFSGIKPVSPTQSKEVRARAVTAEIESGHVYLPHPDEYPWVTLLQDELRNFPSGTNDDMVDTLTQALSELRGGDDVGGITVPGRLQAERRGLGEAPGSRLGMTRVSRALPSVGR